MRTHSFRLKTQTNFQNVIIFGLNLLTNFFQFFLHFVSFGFGTHAQLLTQMQCMYPIVGWLLNGIESIFAFWIYSFLQRAEKSFHFVPLDKNELKRILWNWNGCFVTTFICYYCCLFFINSIFLIVKDFVLLVAHCFSLEKR